MVKHLDKPKVLLWKILPHFAFVIGLFAFVIGLFAFIVGLFSFVSQEVCFVFASRDFFVSQ